jgi:RNA polymerase sigma factor (sigma-70 family)
MGVKLPAFQLLVDAHWQSVARLAHALAGPALADDVAQQAWSKALAAYARLSSAPNLRSWLLTITAHCAMDAMRERARSPVLVPDLALVSEPPQRTETPVSVGDVEEPLWLAVRALPERQRAAIALRYVADLDHAQIARILETTAANSRRLVSDALGTLRAGLATSPDTDTDTDAGPADAARELQP